MKVRSDQGKEFNNAVVKKMFQEKNIDYFTTQNTEIKAHFAEKCIKTIKTKLVKYMHNSNTFKWVDKLNDIRILIIKLFIDQLERLQLL